MKLYLAEMEAAGYTFRAISDSESAAQGSVLEGWLRHHRSNQTSTEFTTVAGLQEQFGLNVLEMEPLACYRDYSKIVVQK